MFGLKTAHYVIPLFKHPELEKFSFYRFGVFHAEYKYKPLLGFHNKKGMIGITHALTALAAAKLLGITTLTDYTTIGVIVFFALLPDIDMPNTELGRIFFPVSRWIYAKYGHRNITHSLITMVVLIWPAVLLGYGVAALLGYGLHLVCDALTYTGIPLFWLYTKNYNILGGPLITGKWLEVVICIVSILVFVLV